MFLRQKLPQQKWKQFPFRGANRLERNSVTSLFLSPTKNFSGSVELPWMVLPIHVCSISLLAIKQSMPSTLVLTNTFIWFSTGSPRLTSNGTPTVMRTEITFGCFCIIFSPTIISTSGKAKKKAPTRHEWEFLLIVIQLLMIAQQYFFRSGMSSSVIPDNTTPYDITIPHISGRTLNYYTVSNNIITYKEKETFYE